MNDFMKPAEKKDTTINEMMVSRQSQEVQAAMVIAKKFPRDQQQAVQRILTACSRFSLAEESEYSFPRGGEEVTGPSIRLAEVVAQNWGNLDYGIIELDNSKGRSEMMAYAWDLETNTRVTKTFTVAHWRDTKQGGYALKDSRDIYEVTANFGARRVRACIIGVIPKDVFDLAVEQCRKTVAAAKTDVPLAARIQAISLKFMNDYNLKQEQLEKYLGLSVKSWTTAHLNKLTKLYASLRDGMTTIDNVFPKTAVNPFGTQTQPANPAKVSDRHKQIKDAHPDWEDWQVEATIKEEQEATHDPNAGKLP
jgi:hypothetical protein